jgi:hypothetical protein
MGQAETGELVIFWVITTSWERFWLFWTREINFAASPSIFPRNPEKHEFNAVSFFFRPVLSSAFFKGRRKYRLAGRHRPAAEKKFRPDRSGNIAEMRKIRYDDKGRGKDRPAARKTGLTVRGRGLEQGELQIYEITQCAGAFWCAARRKNRL